MSAIASSMSLLVEPLTLISHHSFAIFFLDIACSETSLSNVAIISAPFFAFLSASSLSQPIICSLFPRGSYLW